MAPLACVPSGLHELVQAADAIVEIRLPAITSVAARLNSGNIE
jgi:hypothetical protein